MTISDNQLIGNQSYLKGSTIIRAKRAEQAKSSMEKWKFVRKY